MRHAALAADPLAARLDLAGAPWLATGSPPTGLPVPATEATVPTDHDFMALHVAYRRLGGLARVHELSRVWAADGADHRGRLEALIESGRAFAFHWHDAFWLPRFQLDRAAHGTRADVARVLDELGTRWGGWELAAWFVEPNVWLDDRAPADGLGDDLPRVLEAARADRFVRLG